jgi:hypothetical protein
VEVEEVALILQQQIKMADQERLVEEQVQIQQQQLILQVPLEHKILVVEEAELLGVEVQLL